MQTALECDYSDGTAVLRFGGRAARLFCDHPEHRPPEVYDFALIAAALLGMQHSTDVLLDRPVTATAVENVEAILDAFECWRFGDIRRPRLELPQIVGDGALPERGPHRALCFSGGVDSTYTLISDREQPAFSHGLLVHGTDYRAEDAVAFRDLRSYVERMGAKASIEPIVVETDFLATMGPRIELFSGMIYAMCGHFLGKRFASVAFSADHSHMQEYVPLPYNNSYVCNRLSGGAFGFDFRGIEVSRTRKLEAIAEDGRYLRDLKVCWADRSSGRNCGKCSKCLDTRAGLAILGVDDAGMFDAYPDLVASLGRLKFPKTPIEAALAFVRTQDLHHHCPPGPLKDALYARASRLFEEAPIAEFPTRKRHTLSRWLRWASLRT